MIDSSIFTGAIRQKKAEKKKEREAIDAHRAEHARRPAVNRRDKKKKKKEQNKASERQTPLRHRFSSMF